MEILSQEYENNFWKEVENIVYRDNSDDTNLNTTWTSENEKTRFTYSVISHLLRDYGVANQETKEVKLLSDLNVSMDQFDCCRGLSNRTFIFSDQTEAVNKLEQYKDGENYLAPILESINENGEIFIIPVDVFSPDHGLFHALSVALVGKEIFWQPLQAQFYRELKNDMAKYQTCDQLSHSNLENLLDNCNPDEVTGHQADLPIHEMLFIIANVLKRPIILLDSDVKGDDAGIFLPLFAEAETCVKNGVCLAWKNKEKKKLIAIAGMKGNTKLPFHKLPKPWKDRHQSVNNYLPIDRNGKINIKGKMFSEKYLTDLIDCMKNHHKQLYGIGINLVGDVYRCVFQAANFTHVPATAVSSVVKTAFEDVRIYTCLDCRYTGVVPRFLVPDGKLHKQALAQHGVLNFEKKYCFPYLGIQGKAEESTKNIISSKSICRLLSCPMCHQKRMRKVDSEGGPVYFNGDVMPSGKYYWNGKEYDNKPKVIPIGLEWRGDVIPSNIEWFHDETDKTLNSTFEGVVDILVAKHYPDNTETRLRERVKHIVKMRLEQQQDLEIPGIEKRKPPVLPPPPKAIEIPPEKNITDSNNLNSKSSIDEVPADEEVDDDDESDDDEADDDLYGGGSSNSSLMGSSVSQKSIAKRGGSSKQGNKASGSNLTSPSSSQNSKYKPNPGDSPVIPYGNASPEESSDSDNNDDDNLYTRGPSTSSKSKTPKITTSSSSSSGSVQSHKILDSSSSTVPKTVPGLLDSPDASMAVNSVSSKLQSPQSSGLSPVKSKEIKVVFNKGQRVIRVMLPPTVTFKQLQDILADKTSIPNNKQNIKYGFPPKKLQPQGSEIHSPLASISDGDRFIVERDN